MKISDSHHHILSFDIGGTKARAAIVRNDGRIIKKFHQKSMLSSTGDAQEILYNLLTFIKKTLNQSEVKEFKITQIGLGIAGQVNRRGEIVGGNGPREIELERKPIPLKDILLSELQMDMDLIIVNDAQAAAWGEFKFGAGVGTRNMICLTVGTGVGGGIVLNRKLYNGKTGIAGLLGFISVNMREVRNNNGTVGSIEDYCSGSAITQSYLRQLRNQPLIQEKYHQDKDLTLITGEDIFFSAAHDNNPTAQSVIETATFALGIGITSLLHIFEPDLVVIGGGITENETQFLTPVRNTAKKYCLPNFRHTPIIKAKLGNEAGLIGAAALCF